MGMDLDMLRRFFTDLIPFNKHLGLELDDLSKGRAVISVRMRPEFIGDPLKRILHGGVISTMIDVTGGLTAFSVLDWPRETSLNTIDMRVDYVRMGKGERFICEGNIIRKGNRIAVSRADLKDEEGRVIALGTATYNIFSNPDAVPEQVRKAATHMLADEGSDTEER